MQSLLHSLPISPTLFYLLIAWSLVWKGIALWHAAGHKQLAWYVALLIINTVGILEIVYLLFFRKKDFFRR